MEEENSNKIVEAKTEPNSSQNKDWRLHFAPLYRKKIVNKLYALVKNQSPSSDPSYLNRAATIASQFEEMVFRSAATKDNYLIIMHQKMKVMEDYRRRTIASSSGTAKTSTVDDVEQRGQPLQQPPLQHQLLQPNNSSLFIGINSGEVVGHQHSHQPIIRNQERKQLTGEQLNAAVLQENQKFVQQHVGVSDKLQNSLSLQNASTSFQQPLITSNNVSAKQNIVSQEGLPNRVEQYKLVTSQQVLLDASKASSESAAVTKTLNLADWHDQAYQELQSLRTKYLPDLKILLGNTYKLYYQERDSVLSEHHKNIFRAIEKMIRFLLLPRSEFGNYSREYFKYYWQAILHCHYNIQRTNSVPVQEAAQLQPPAAHSQIPLPQQSRNVKPRFSPVSLVMESTPAPSPVSAVHQGIPNSHPNTMTLSPSGSLDNVLSSIQHDSPSSECQSIAGMPQQITSFSQKMSVNGHDSDTAPFQQQKQQYVQQRMQPPKLRQQEAIEMEKPHTLMQNIHECKNPHHVQSPVASHLSRISPQIDNQNSPPLSKATMTLHSATSSFITAPPASLTPSSSPLDVDEHHHSVSPLSKSDHVQHPQMNAEITESTNIDNGNQQSNTTKLKPIDRLIRAVTSMTPLALNAAVNDIGSVINMADVIADTGVGCNSRVAVSEDLAYTTRCSVRDSKISSACANKKKHNVSSLSFDQETESSMFLISQRCEPEIIATPWITRP